MARVSVDHMMLSHIFLVILILYISPQLHASGPGDINVDPDGTIAILNYVRAAAVLQASPTPISNMNTLVSSI